MTQPVSARRIVIALNQTASDALDRLTEAEGLNASTIVCRALQVYDKVMEAQESDGIGGVVINGEVMEVT